MELGLVYAKGTNDLGGFRQFLTLNSSLLNEKLPLGNNADTTLLYTAAREGRVEEVKLLLEMKADPNIQIHSGSTALHVACYRGHLAVVEALRRGNGDGVAANRELVNQYGEKCNSVFAPSVSAELRNAITAKLINPDAYIPPLGKRSAASDSQHSGEGASGSKKAASAKEALLSGVEVGSEFADAPTPFIDDPDYGDGLPPLTVVELVCHSLKRTILRKPQWEKKILDDTICGRWRKELLKAHVQPAQIEYAISELKWCLEHPPASLGCPVLQVAPDIHVSFEAMESGALGDRIRSMFSKLEGELPRDWHPGSNEQVLDLVHPSLYCYVDGVTPVVEDVDLEHPKEWHQFLGSGKPMTLLKQPSSGKAKYGSQKSKFSSERFQWLPSEVVVDSSGKAEFKSYINGLNPLKYKEEYAVIAEGLSRMIPLFERTLGGLMKQTPLVEPDMDEETIYGEGPQEKDYKDTDSYYEACDEWNDTRQPKPCQFNAVFSEEESLPVASLVPESGKLRHLQVIVKLANIELTPEKPEYPGGTWHVEGTLNENIIATGIYYAEMENITKSMLNFRRSCCEPEYEQSDDKGVWEVYRLQNEEPLCQDIAKVQCREKELITWPNTLQHQVQPFKLEDPTKPGYRKILVYFLINPSLRTLSTAYCPPTRKEWLVDAVVSKGALPLPPELSTMVASKIPGWPIEKEQALQYRLELMEERKKIIDTNTKEVFEREFSLCEH